MDKLQNAKRPVILLGEGVRFGNAYEDMLRLVDKLKIPVVTAWNANDQLWDDHLCFAAGREQ